jgi:hypothetical protein
MIQVWEHVGFVLGLLVKFCSPSLLRSPCQSEEIGELWRPQLPLKLFVHVPFALIRLIHHRCVVHIDLKQSEVILIAYTNSSIAVANMSAAPASRAVARQSRFLLRRNNLRHASTTAETASKAGQGLSRVTSSAGSMAAGAAAGASEAASKVQGRTGRIISLVQGQN